ncbi:D-glycerate dehydrogenase [Sphingobium sp. Sx8-8]|uniref:2-hydroxyacid dehydrogenase n=1 Tax=Sphingobium sp. Sx8-8 TaxID=2933617 RepID=UPI0032AFDE8E
MTRLWPQSVLEKMAQLHDMTFDPADRPLEPTEIAQAMRDFDILCPTITDRITAGMFSVDGLRVRMIANFGAGHEHIDLEAAKAAGVTVTNTPDVLTQSTAELGILLMLMAARRAGEGERQLRARGWPGWHPTHMMGRSLHGAHLGLIGYGRIAQATARMASDLWDMKISYHSRRPVPDGSDPLHATYVESLPMLLRSVDVLSLQCPGGPATHHLLNAEMIALLKRDAILINTARGSVVDEAALADALGEGRLAGAGLDVYEREPAVHPGLRALDNVVLLPHLGSATIETRTAMGLRALANIDAFVSGREPADRVA